MQFFFCCCLLVVASDSEDSSCIKWTLMEESQKLLLETNMTKTCYMTMSENGHVDSKKYKKTKICGFSPQGNYTDRATATCQRSWCQLLRIEGVTCSAQWIPMAINFGVKKHL
jgi:hypothetical protein